VEFRIAAGTGTGPWNTYETAVRIQVGQTLRVYNDDSVAHAIHANGAPFPHGKKIAPGAFRDHLVVNPSEPSPGSPRLYEHTAGRSAGFWVIATR
jgi:plastocyanin